MPALFDYNPPPPMPGIRPRTLSEQSSLNALTAYNPGRRAEVIDPKLVPSTPKSLAAVKMPNRDGFRPRFPDLMPKYQFPAYLRTEAHSAIGITIWPRLLAKLAAPSLLQSYYYCPRGRSPSSRRSPSLASTRCRYGPLDMFTPCGRRWLMVL